MPLIRVSTMSIVECDDYDNRGNMEEVQCDRETQMNQLEEIFRLKFFDVHIWSLGTNGDNWAANKRMDRLLNIHHVGWMSHELNIGVSSMVKHHRLPRTTIDIVHQNMSNYKHRLRIRAIVCNLTLTLSCIDERSLVVWVMYDDKNLHRET